MSRQRGIHSMGISSFAAEKIRAAFSTRASAPTSTRRVRSYRCLPPGTGKSGASCRSSQVTVCQAPRASAYWTFASGTWRARFRTSTTSRSHRLGRVTSKSVIRTRKACGPLPGRISSGAPRKAKSKTLSGSLSWSGWSTC